MREQGETLEKENINISLMNEFDEWRSILNLAEYALMEVYTKFDIFSKDMDEVHKNPIEHIKKRVKKFDSIIEKLERKELPLNMDSAIQYIDDIAGLRIVCPFESDILIVKNYIDKLERENMLKVIEIKDYINEPKANGYKSLHVIVEVPIKLYNNTKFFKVEIQIRTVAMDFWACLEHKMLYKKDRLADTGLLSKLKGCADMISLLDKEMSDIKKELIHEEKKK